MTGLVILKDRQAVTTSLQVAEAFNKQHKYVLEAYDNLMSSGVAENSADLFWEDTYKHPQNKQDYRIIYMNRDGFSLLAMGFTGKKALQFKIKYIEAFNQMEKRISQPTMIPTSHRDQVLLVLRASEETNERIDGIENDIEDIKNNQLLNEPDYRTISTMVRNKIRVICNQQHLNAGAKTELFKDLNGGIKRITGAAARNRIKAKQFDDVVKFINNWMPSTATMTIIEQMELIEEE